MSHDVVSAESARNESPASQAFTLHQLLANTGISRRQLLAWTGGAACALGGAAALWQYYARKKAPVFLASGQRYDGSLVQTMEDGLRAVGFHLPGLAGKRVLLKPNMVEPTRASPHMTTHPLIVAAAAEVFRRWGASVKVGEAPGHMRDTEYALLASRIGETLRDERIPFADLNYEQVGWRTNFSRYSKLKGIYFPASVLEADLIVSLPKLKTHHWVGVTASMKNLYGALPGIKYGWPKNVLHFHGIPQTVCDINAALPNTIAIVDAVDCMEGDGPILGSCKKLGMIAISTSPAAVDATCARIMGLDPARIPYLKLVRQRWAPVDEARMEERGESWRSLYNPFQLINFPHIQELKSGPLLS